MTRPINSHTFPCTCRVWRYRTTWLPSTTCTSHADKPIPTALDYLRRLTQKAIAS